MRKKTKKILIFALAVLLIVSPFLILPIGDGGAFATKLIVTLKMKQYLNAVYDYKGDVSARYNYMHSEWAFYDIPFGVSCSTFAKHIHDDSIHNYYLDNFHNDLTRIDELLAQEDKIDYSYLCTNILANGKYSKDYSSMETSQKLYLTIRLFSAESQATSKAEMLYSIIECLGDDYAINSFQVFFVDDGFTYIFEGDNLSEITVKKLESTLEITERSEDEKRIEKERIDWVVP